MVCMVQDVQVGYCNDQGLPLIRVVIAHYERLEFEQFAPFITIVALSWLWQLLVFYYVRIDFNKGFVVDSVDNCWYAVADL